MSTQSWNWKGKDGSRGRLLYEPGNWGDLLKLCWASIVVEWMENALPGKLARYYDPFAGAPEYALAEKTGKRFNRVGAAGLGFVGKPYVEKRLWPSTAAAIGLLTGAERVVFDADPDRFAKWRGAGGVLPEELDSGWEMPGRHEPRPDELWLIDPYDMLAEWREHLSGLLARAGSTNMLFYVYNRSAKGPEAFAEYRAFRNALEDNRAGKALLVGRLASDAFLPRAHHEMYFLPSREMEADAGFSALGQRLEEATVDLNRAQLDAYAFES